MPDKPAGGTRRITIEEALMNVSIAVKYCTDPNDRGFYKKDGTCGTDAYCPFRAKDQKCKRHKPNDSGIVRKVVEAGFGEETKGNLEPVKDPNASQPISSLIPKVAPTGDDCFNGGMQYFKGGYCIAKECPYQTEIKMGKRVKQGDEIVKMELPKCVAHCLFGCAIDGDKSLYIEDAQCCMATGRGEKCEHQDEQVAQFLGDTRVVFCKKYSV